MNTNTACVQDEVTLQTVEDCLRCLVESYQLGGSQLPGFMGLGQLTYFQLLESLGCQPVVIGLIRRQKENVLAELISLRQMELEELQRWLHQFAINDRAELVAKIIATASLGFNHLWQDLGLESRQQLGDIMRLCFPTLAAMNNQHMRWKKFFYRQQCMAGGGFVCRSPSCEQCVERSNCFAPEE